MEESSKHTRSRVCPRADDGWQGDHTGHDGQGKRTLHHGIPGRRPFCRSLHGRRLRITNALLPCHPGLPNCTLRRRVAATDMAAHHPRPREKPDLLRRIGRRHATCQQRGQQLPERVPVRSQPHPGRQGCSAKPVLDDLGPAARCFHCFSEVHRGSPEPLSRPSGITQPIPGAATTRTSTCTQPTSSGTPRMLSKTGS